MNEEYDVIVLGTGLKECVLSGLLSVAKNKVLHMDRNGYYGGESASLSMDDLFRKFEGDDAKAPEDFGRSRDYNVDLCPKFIMSCGNLVKVLLHTKVTRYLEFKSVAGSFVYKDKKIHKVPATPSEGMRSGLMGMFQKRYFRNFVQYVDEFDENNKATWKDLDPQRTTCAEVFKKFGLDDNTISFVGHALALYLSDDYLEQPMADLIQRVKLYAYSINRYGNSPYIYPMWGLGGLPEGFSRLAAIYGGVYMLNKPIEEILYDEEGKVKGVKSEGEVAYCKKLLCDPSYVAGTDKVRLVGRVARAICIMDHPIPNTGDADSCQIIIPQRAVNRHNDIYVACASYHHQVAAQGKWVAICSAIVESKSEDDAEIRSELAPAFALLGKVQKEFFWVSDMFEPTDDGTKDNVFVSRSFDASSHFEVDTTEVLDLYQRMTGNTIDLTIPADLDQEE